MHACVHASNQAEDDYDGVCMCFFFSPGFYVVFGIFCTINTDISVNTFCVPGMLKNGCDFTGTSLFFIVLFCFV